MKKARVDFVSTFSVCRSLEINFSTLHALIKKGSLPRFFSIEGKLVFDKKEIRPYVKIFENASNDPQHRPWELTDAENRRKLIRRNNLQRKTVKEVRLDG